MADTALLLQLCLPYLRRDLQATIECHSELRISDDGEAYPVAGTLDPIALADARNLVALIREIEGEIETPNPAPGPEWLDDAIDRRSFWWEAL